MAQFRFTVYDPGQDRTRTGSLKAKDLTEARALIETRGLEIRSLKEDKKTVLAFRGQALVGRPEGELVYTPTLGERLDLALRLGFYQKLFIGAGVVLGVLLLLTNLVHSPAPPTREVQPMADVRLEVRGQLQVPPEQMNKARVTIRLPQVPFRHAYPANELLDSSGNYKIELELRTRKGIGFCEILVECPGYLTVHQKRIVLSGEPLTGVAPPATLRPDKRGS